MMIIFSYTLFLCMRKFIKKVFSISSCGSAHLWKQFQSIELVFRIFTTLNQDVIEAMQSDSIQREKD